MLLALIFYCQRTYHAYSLKIYYHLYTIACFLEYRSLDIVSFKMID